VKLSSQFESSFRAVTPLVLLGVLFALVFENSLPGASWLKYQLGDTAILRVCIAVLVFYVLLLWGEAIRLHTSLTGVLQALRQFGRDSEPRSEAAKNPKARLEAARLLIAAMRSDDASIRATSRHNLARLVGEDFGDDPAAWQRWLQQQDAGGTTR
jgi:hypothetical protein